MNAPLASRRHPGILAGDARHERPALIPDRSTGEKLADLLDYIEQVVRLDERVALRLADYRLPDGSALAIRAVDVEGLPGITLDNEESDGPVWLAIERLARTAPPEPPEPLGPWIAPSADPEIPPTLVREQLRTVSATERAALIAADAAAEEDFAPVPPREGESDDRYDLRLRLEDRPGLEAACEDWIATLWRSWANDEAPRRRTIVLYGQIYRFQQALELGGGDGAVEAVWGIGTVRWRRDGKVLDRPLLDCTVEIELAPEGRLTVRPTEAAPRIDLKPFEEIGCANLLGLEDVARAGLAAIEAAGGPSPFRLESVEPLLRTIATRLAAEGAYRAGPAADPTDAPVVAGDWVFHARPRSRHVVLDDIARFRAAARAGGPVEGLAARLVTPPSGAAPEPWTPLGDGHDDAPSPEDPAFGEVFFPKPFNADQIAIVRRLERADGLVVQGPPGTGKTHTIANLICHAMALGQRILVVSRGEAALSVLRDQLPEKVRPLTIALLASERQGLRQVEGAIREIQAAVEESRPEIRASAIRRCETEIDKIRGRLAAIDREIDAVADHQALPLGPRGELPADLARRVAAGREARAWFDDTPTLFADETGLDDERIAALIAARTAVGAALDHRDAALPPLSALPDAAEVAGWHAAAIDARRFADIAAASPARGLRLEAGQVEVGAGLAKALHGLASAGDALAAQPWLAPHAAALAAGEDSPDGAELRAILEDWSESERERQRLAPLAIELPPGLVEDREAREAIERLTRGERAFGRLSLGHGPAKDRVAAIRIGGAPIGPDPEAWRRVADALALGDRQRALVVRWRDFAASLGMGAEAGSPAAAGRLLGHAKLVRTAVAALGAAGRDLPPVAVFARDARLTQALADGIEAAAACARLAETAHLPRELAAGFPGSDRTAAVARQILEDLVGRDGVPAERVSALWTTLRDRVAEIEVLAPAFETIRRTTAAIEAAGAPRWAARLRTDPSPDILPETWRDVWDLAAAERHLAAIDGRETLSGLAREREALDRRARKLFVELVRERSFLALERRLSPKVKSALVEYVRAVGRLGKGTGKGAGRHRRTAREAMSRCYDAVPCWIMPTWRVAEQLPSDIASFDLVIVDEASQSDVTELPALLRGRKILAVGDDRQVSPTPPFVTQNKVDQLRHHYLRGLPYAALLEPGESLYDLLRAVFPDSRIMLKEHFRCVEPIIRFSMGFYPEKLVPLRVPAASERLDPPLVDIFVPHGARDGARKLNRAEAEVIVEEIAALAADPAMAGRSVGVISLVGSEQAELVRVKLSERIGEETMQRHRVLCGNAASFQGNERDIVFLSMVADRQNHSALTTQRYEQRFNVAASRARDRLVLVRSVGLDDLASNDLRAKLISHFEGPTRAAEAPADLADACESGFERDVMERLVALGYRVQPQVGSEGFRIDLVVEDFQGRRLAVECDGDGFHGPERWRDDMRRQRILERVGWRFWRCFASSFYRDPEAVMADLVATLTREGIAPIGAESGGTMLARIVEHRVAAAPQAATAVEAVARGRDGAGGLVVGDRVALLFPDRKRLTLRLTDGADDRAGGLLSVSTPLGAAVVRSDEGDEIVLDEDGAATRVLVEAVERAA